ncbi:MAG: hypothetical protein A2X52_13745 [Candidatus Rokubacteria bacterium GWC2_70_16]|nr:MAG: hypothetical protein A2X52_13745 [Candidatus Rokubacteria bacterium GWC2_70_16]
MRPGIRAKLSAALLLAVVLAAAASAWVAVRVYGAFSEDTTTRDLAAARRTVQAILDLRQEAALGHAEVLAKRDDVMAAIIARDREALVRLGRRFQQEHGLDFVLITDVTGIALARPHAPAEYGDDASEFVTVRGALHGLALATIRRAPVIRLGVSGGAPVFERGPPYRVMGAAIAGFALDQPFVADLKKTIGLDVSFILDGDRHVSTLPGSPALHPAALAAAGAPGETPPVEIRVGGEEYRAIYAALRGRDSGAAVGSLEIAKPLSAEKAARTRVVWTIAGAVSLLSLGVLGMALWLSARITRPLNRLMRAAEEVGSGDLGHRVQVDGDDEVGRLGLAFNQMADDVQRSRGELAASEERYRELYESAPSGYLATAGDGRITQCNRAMVALLGAGSAENLIGRPVMDLWADTPSGRERAVALARRLYAGEDLPPQEIQMRRADGSPIWVTASVNATRDAAGAIVLFQGSVVDITERKRAEEALADARDAADKRLTQLHMALRASQAGTYELDLTTGVGVCSPEFEAIYGMPPGELSGKPMAEWEACLVAEDRQQARADIQRVIEEGAAVSNAFRIRRRDNGEVRWIEARGRVFYDPDHRPVRMVGVNIDITERKRAEEALRESEARLRLALDAAHMGTFDSDVPHDHITWSHWHEELWGFKAGEFGGTYEAFSQRLHPDDLPGINAEVARCIAAREPFAREFRVVWPDGSVHWVQARGEFTFDTDGQPLRMRGAVVETTARRAAEGELREKEHLLSESQRIAHVGGWGWDLTGPIKWTDETYRIYGVSPETFTPTIESLVSLLHPEDRPAMQGWIEACGAGRAPDELEFRAILPDGSVRFLNGRGDLIYDTGNRPAFMAGTVQDITERKRAEATLRQSEERYRLLFQGATDGMFVFHLTAEGVPGRFIEVNESGCAMLGYSREELLRLTPLDVEVPEAASTRAELSRQILSERRATFQRTLLAKDGRRIPAEITSHLFQLDGRPTVLAVNRDISERKRLEETARGLAEVGRELAGMADFTEASKLVTARLVETAGFRRSILYLRDPSSGLLTCVAGSGDGDPAQWIGKTLAVGEALSGAVAVEGQAMWSADLLLDHRFSLPGWMPDLLLSDNCRAWASVPLIAEGEVLGTLALGASTGRRFTEGEIQVLSAFAGEAGLALRNARLLAETERRRREAWSLAELARSAAEDLSLSEVGRRVIGGVMALYGPRLAGLRVARTDGSLEIVASAGVDFPVGHALAPGEGMAGRAARERRLVFVEDITTDPRVLAPAALHDAYLEKGLRSVLAVPLRVREAVVGTLAMGFGERMESVDPRWELLQAFADQAALAVANARLFEEQERRRREAETLAGVVIAMGTSLELDTILERVTEGARDLCRSDLARIAVREAGEEAARVRYWVGPRPRGWEGFSIEPGKGLGGRVLATGRPCRTENYAEDPRLTKDYLAVAVEEGTVAGLGVPIVIADRTDAVLMIFNRSPRPFTDGDEAILLRLADHAAIAITNARLYRQLQETGERLRALSRQLMGAQEAERRRLARELHDELGQALTAVKLTLQALPGPGASAGLGGRLDEAMGLVDRALSQVRDLSLDLRPSLLDDLGLASALRWYVTRQAERSGLAATVAADLGETRPGPDIETACFRVVQEAMTNAVRHAGARSVSVEVKGREGEIALVVRDDGAGFDVEAARSRATLGESLGLLGMEERVLLLGGTLDIESAPGQGTEVRARIPLGPPSGSTGHSDGGTGS